MRSCDVYLTFFALAAVGALVGIERLGVDRWTVVSRPTVGAVLVAAMIGLIASSVDVACSRSPRQGNTWALPLRYEQPTLRALTRASFAFLLVAGLALAYIRVASEYLPGNDFALEGKVVSITKATRWQNPCDSSLAVALNDGRSITFCEVTAWGQSIGPRAIKVGDAVVVHLRSTRWFLVVQRVESATK